MQIDIEEQQQLIALAKSSIEYGIEHQAVMPLTAEEIPKKFSEERASFVTLRLEGRLRGCIGAIEPIRPLAVDIVHNAHAAAFLDPRFSPLTGIELHGLDIHISILTPPERLEFSSEEDLIAKIRAGIDGLLFEAGDLAGAFIPAMWEQIADPKEFLRHLKIKAGLSPDFWSDNIVIHRFTSEHSIHS